MSGMNVQVVLQELIQSVIKEGNKEIRETTEKKIYECLSIFENTPIVLEMIATESVPASIRTYITTFFTKIINDSKEQNPEFFIQIFEKVFQYLFDPNVSFDCKRNLLKLISNQLSSTYFLKKDCIEKKLRKTLGDRLKGIELSSKQTALSSRSTIYGLLLAFKAYSLTSTSSELVDDFKNILKQMNLIFENALSSLLSYLTTINTSVEMNPNERNIIVETMNLFLEYTRVIKKWIMNFQKNKKHKIGIPLESLQSVFPSLQVLLTIKIGRSENQSNNIFWSNNDEILNELRFKIYLNILQTFVVSEKYYIAQKSQNAFENSFVETYNQYYIWITKLVLQSLYMLGGDYKEEGIGKKNALRQLICKSLKLLSISSSDFSFFEIFAFDKEAIITSIVLPSLSTPKSQIEEIIDDPDEFVRFTIEMINSKKFSTPRFAFISFFKSMSTYIDGSISFTIKSIIDFLKFTIAGSPLDKISEYESLPLFVSSPFFVKRTEEERAEVCFIILAALKEQVFERTDLLERVGELLITNGAMFLSPNISVLLKSRFIMVSVPYLQELNNKVFKENDKRNMVISLYKTIVNELSSNATVSQTAIVAILEAIKRDKTALFFAEIFREINAQIIPRISQNGQNPYFSIIKCFVSKYTQKYVMDSEIMKNLIDAIFERAVNEVKSPNSNERTQAISNCFSLLTSISCQKTLLNMFFQQIDTCLLPFIQFLKSKNENFDEDIIEFYLIAGKSINKISSDPLSIIELCLKLHEIYNSKLSSFLPLLNLLFQLSPTCFNPVNIQLLIQASIKTIYGNYETKSEDYYKSEGLILLQLIVLYVPNFLDNNIQKNLMQISTSLIYENQTKTRSLILDKAYGLYFSLIFTMPCPLPYIQETFSQILGPFPEKISIFETIYDRKLAINGFISIIDRLASVRAFTEVSLILNWLVPYLMFNFLKSITEKIDSINSKRERTYHESSYFEDLSTILNDFPFFENNNYATFEESDPNDVIGIEDVLGAESNHNPEKGIIVSRLVHPLMNIDENLALERFFNNLKQNNQTDYQNLLNSCSALCQKFVFQLIRTIRYVKVHGGEESDLHLRKIVKVK